MTMNQGKIERNHYSIWNIFKLQNDFSPSELEEPINKFVEHHNNQRLDEAIDN